MVSHTKLSYGSVFVLKSGLLSCHAHGKIWTRTQPSCGLEYNSVIWLQKI